MKKKMKESLKNIFADAKKKDLTEDEIIQEIMYLFYNALQERQGFSTDNGVSELSYIQP